MDIVPDPASDAPLDQSALSAALYRTYAEDVRGFLGVFAVLLEAALPQHTQIERRMTLFGKPLNVRKVTITLHDDAFSLADDGRGGLSALRVKTVRGIVLRRDPMPVSAWLELLSERLAEQAGQSERAFFALRGLLSP